MSSFGKIFALQAWANFLHVSVVDPQWANLGKIGFLHPWKFTNG